jgi:hypothetical protein
MKTKPQRCLTDVLKYKTKPSKMAIINTKYPKGKEYGRRAAMKMKNISSCNWIIKPLSKAKAKFEIDKYIGGAICCKCLHFWKQETLTVYDINDRMATVCRDCSNQMKQKAGKYYYTFA